MICALSLRVGHANFTTVEEIPPGEEVLAGMFFLFEHPIIILFNYGASHDFMNLAYAQKAKLTLWATKVSYSISTPGSRVVVDLMVRKIPLDLIGRVFPTSLIILEGQGINVIIGMNRMKMHKAVLDISTHLVHLDSAVSSLSPAKISLQLPPVARLQASIHAAVAKSLHEIHVVHEYPNVFPDDLLGMPSYRAIEFKIEL
jgi:hypothetical protein